MTDKTLITSMEQIESKIFLIRSQKVMLDADLAELYGVETKRLNEQVRRNSERFPIDFMFQLTNEELIDLKEKIDTSCLRSQFATSNTGRGGRRHLPFVFTEHGAIMAASVLNSPRAIEASVQVVRAFVQLRQMLSSNAELARRLAALEKNYDIKFKAVFEAIHELMTPPTSRKKRPIGFAPWEND
ncbi:MAG: ORF6N domain-containing protein [Gallionella sp.]|jgi:hypothetical protein